MEIKMGTEGRVAKVTSISEDDYRVYIEYRNGTTTWFEQSETILGQGDIIFMSTTEDATTVTKMPSSAWPDYLWVGIVKLKHQDVTVVEADGRLRRLPTNLSVEYAVDNTVEACDLEGVVRVLSEKPIKRFDLNDEIDDEALERFRWTVPEGEKLDFGDFGGLKQVVGRARELIELTLLRSQDLSEIGVKPIKGVLFTGAPGTGKTMLARIIAAQSGAAFFEVSGPQIFSKWYGQSEEFLRRLFEMAEKETKSIIFFDEIDSVASKRDDHSHEASKRVVAQLLTLMDGFNPNKNVIVIAATNRPQDLDDALRRPGRFDWEIEFPFPEELDREDILKKTARELKIAEPLPHDLVAKMSAGWTGADLSAIWKEAALLAVSDKRKSICTEDYIGGFERVSRQRDKAQKGG